MRIGSLCSGYGGLELAAETIWEATSVAWVADPDRAASRALAEHWPLAPNLGDLTLVDWDSVEPIDILTAGWPCQPFSRAGKQRGGDDERAIWPAIADAIRVVRPRLLLLENVAAVVGIGELGRVADSLASLRYELRWVCLRAADVGAPHRRDRLFLVAVGAPLDAQHSGPLHPATGLPRVEPRPRRDAPPDASGSRPQGTRHSAREPRESRDVDWGDYGPAIRRWERLLDRAAPSPVDDRNRLEPRFVEWMMGLPNGWVTDLGLSRSATLRLLGNGVVPQQAAHAYRSLLAL